MGWPLDKFDRRFEDILNQLDVLHKYAEKQRTFGFPVTTEEVEEYLVEITDYLHELHNLHNEDKGKDAT